MEINTVADLDEALERGPWAWPGGYPLYFITDDGGALSFKTVKEEYDQIAESIEERLNDGWQVVALEINYEDGELYDDHSGERIESAYAEDD